MAKMKLGETNLNVPITPDYKERLAARANAHDREMGREAARIVKDVLDGRYVKIRTTDDLEISSAANDLKALPRKTAAETAGADATSTAPAEAEMTESPSGELSGRLSPSRAGRKLDNALAAWKDGRSHDLKGTAKNENLGE